MRIPALRAFVLIGALSMSWMVVSASAQVQRMNLEELTRASSAIVVGETDAPRSFWNDKGTQILTEVRVRVSESVKGSVGDEVVITVPGGRVGNTLYEVSDMPVFVEGEEILVFLWEHPSGRQLVTAGVTGKLEIAQEGREKVVRGAPALLRDERPLGKTNAEAGEARTSTGSMSVDDLLAQIRSYAGQ